MPEILTESFCERCGTRYTFEAAAPRSGRLSRLKLLSKGLRNYVLSDESSLGDAFAAAESEEDRERAGQQLDAFHKTFNFCMTCRQYTCGNCWNEAEGRCLTCAPGLGREILPAFVGGLGGMEPGSTVPGPQPEAAASIAASAWPTIDLPAQPAQLVTEPTAIREPAPLPDLQTVDMSSAPVDQTDHLNGADAQPAESAAPIQVQAGEPGAIAAEALAAEPALAEPAPPEVEAHAPDAAAGLTEGSDEADQGGVPPDVAAARAAARTADLLARFRPEPAEPLHAGAVNGSRHDGVDIDSEALQPDTGVAPEPMEPAPAAPPVALEANAPTVEPLPAETTPPPAPVVTETALPTGPAAPPVDVVAQPVWQTVAPDLPMPPGTAVPSIPPAGPGETPAGPVQVQAQATPPGEPAGASAPLVWPSFPAPSPTQPSRSIPGAPSPAWPPAPGIGDTPAWPPPLPTSAGGVQWPQAAPAREAIWAESSRDVLNRPGSGVQACVSCGLPLSATARFCRRCGSRQG